MTSRPPPRTRSTRSRPSVSTSRNSMSEAPGQGGSTSTTGHSGKWAWPVSQTWGNLATPGANSLTAHYPPPYRLPLHRRIQFSSPSLFLGGPGMFSRTSRASWERVTMTSLSFTAVCMRRTLDWSLQGMQLTMGPTPAHPQSFPAPIPPPPSGPKVAESAFAALTA